MKKLIENRQLLRNSALTLSAIVFLATIIPGSCTGPAAALSFRADERGTAALARASNFKLCAIEHDRMCQSPDGNITFHFPVQLNFDRYKLYLADVISISNSGFSPVNIEEYNISLTDDKDRLYRPEFIGPDSYSGGRSDSPALTVAPLGKFDIRFWTTLAPESRGLKSISIAYRLQGDREFTRVVVSYRAGVYLGTN